MAEAATDIVLVGGGHSHVHVLKAFGQRPEPGVRLTLVARALETPYSGMLPGLIAGLYDHDQTHLDLVRLCRFAGARLVWATATGLDREARRVLFADRAPVRYDLLSLDIGSTPRATVPGAAEHVTPLKPVDHLSRRWEQVVARVLESRVPLRLTVVGGGAAGIEVALSAEHALRLKRRAQGLKALAPEVSLVTSGTLLHGHAAAVRRAFLREAARRGVTVHEQARVARVEAGALIMEDGRRLPFDECLWATQAAGAPWLAETGLALDEAGFVTVGETLQSLTDPRILAAGDVATMDDHPRPKAGVMAVRQGPPLADALRRLARGQAAKAFRPQKRFLALIGTGDGRAVASRGRWAAQGAWVWWWKDHIDRAWMRQYQELPPPRSTAVVTGTVPSDLSARLGLPPGPALPDAPNTRLVTSEGRVMGSVSSDPWRLGRMAAVEAMLDLHAMGAEPVAAVPALGLPGGAAARWLEDDVDLMLRGAADVLGCAMGGGEVTAAPLSAGFTVTGRLTKPPRQAAGLRPGDALVLTKPLGTGILLAAAQEGRARARWLAAAWESMAASSGEASRVFDAAGVQACVGVRDRGLLGALRTMLEASAVDAEVTLAALPLLAGVAEASAVCPPQDHEVAVVNGPAPLILTDPQTAGGLLAGVAAERLPDVLAALPTAAVIGHVLPRSGEAVRVRLV